MAISGTMKRPFSDLKAVLFSLGIFMIGVAVCTVIFTIIFYQGVPPRKDFLNPWIAAKLIDSFINILVIAAWIIYKEPSWISALLWIVALICFGSFTTCFYVHSKFLKFTPSQESSEDPIYYVLLRPKVTKEGMEEKSIFSVADARLVLLVFCCLMSGALTYAIKIDGSPFRVELLTPLMIATLFSSYINVGLFSVWVSYKESSRIFAYLWILLCICSGSIGTCAYILVQLHHFSAKDPAYLILPRSSIMS